MSSLRGTGRTTKMLEQAIRTCCVARKSLYVVAHTNDYALDLCRRCSDMHKFHKVTAFTCEMFSAKITFVSVNWFDANRKLLKDEITTFDHFVYEAKL